MYPSLQWRTVRLRRRCGGLRVGKGGGRMAVWPLCHYLCSCQTSTSFSLLGMSESIKFISRMFTYPEHVAANIFIDLGHALVCLGNTRLWGVILLLAWFYFSWSFLLNHILNANKTEGQSKLWQRVSDPQAASLVSPPMCLGTVCSLPSVCKYTVAGWETANADPETSVLAGEKMCKALEEKA